MKLHKSTFANRVAKLAAPILSSVLTLKPIHKLGRIGDAYYNFLTGKGSGTGWNLEAEIATAVGLIHRSKPVVFDVGANIGTWTEEMLKRLPDAKITMFEPSPECQAVIRGKGLKDVCLIPKGVSDTPGRVSLYRTSETDGAASIYERGDTVFSDLKYSTVEIELTTVDAIIEEFEIPFIDFMKMDIEGNEFKALEGAKKALKERKIGALSFEFGSGNINSRNFFKDFWELLRGYGYSFFRVTPAKRVLEIDSYYEDLEYFRGVTNYVCTLNDHPFKG